MKPHTYRVHFGNTWQDFPRRCDANGFAILKRASGYPGAYVQPLGY